MKHIFILIDTCTGERYYFDTEELRDKFCKDILSIALRTNRPANELPIFGYDDNNINDFCLSEDIVNPSFDEDDWKEWAML